jgi:CMP-N-acetylneuraminic acid synthetase
MITSKNEEIDELKKRIAEISKFYGASVPLLRPPEYATDLSSDIDWVLHSLYTMVKNPLDSIELVSILRPTSPLRSSKSIIRGTQKLKNNLNILV